MKNLIKATEKKLFDAHKEFMARVREIENVNEVTKYNSFGVRLPKGKDVSKMELNDLKAYLIERDQKRLQKELNRNAEQIHAIEGAEKVQSISIGVEWKKSAMYGANPTATIRVTFEGGKVDVFNGHASGCGYDKESAAIAEALNQCNGVLKMLYIKKNKKADAQNRELLGYGSGYGVLPRFEGGVGFECHRRIFEGLGFKTERTASGKSFDAYVIHK